MASLVTWYIVGQLCLDPRTQAQATEFQTSQGWGRTDGSAAPSQHLGVRQCGPGGRVAGVPQQGQGTPSHPSLAAGKESGMDDSIQRHYRDQGCGTRARRECITLVLGTEP